MTLPVDSQSSTTITLEVDIRLLKHMLRQRILHISDLRCQSHDDKVRLQRLLLQAIAENH